MMAEPLACWDCEVPVLNILRVRLDSTPARPTARTSNPAQFVAGCTLAKFATSVTVHTTPIAVFIVPKLLGSPSLTSAELMQPLPMHNTPVVLHVTDPEVNTIWVCATKLVQHMTTARNKHFEFKMDRFSVF